MTPEELSEIISDILCRGLLGFEVKGKENGRGKNN
jgi:hypothetical protein